MVKNVTPKYIECETTDPDGTKRMERIPYGLLVWATGNAVRPVVRDLMAQLPEPAESRRGLLVTESLQVRGAAGVWAAGDCAVASTAGGGGYAPTAQVAGQQGGFLARILNARARSDALEAELAGVEERLGRAATAEARDALLAEFKALQKRLRRVQARIGPFEYSHQGSLAYIGSEKAVADISWLSGNLATGGTLTYLFWRSAYLSMTWSGEHFPLNVSLGMADDRSAESHPGLDGLGQDQDVRPGCLARVVISCGRRHVVCKWRFQHCLSVPEVTALYPRLYSSMTIDLML